MDFEGCEKVCSQRLQKRQIGVQFLILAGQNEWFLLCWETTGGSVNKLSASVAPLVIAILSSTPNAHADSITYDISGVASGEIGATTFTNASVELTGIGDTANVTSL